MWLAPLRQLLAGKSHSRPIKTASPKRRWIIPRLDHLEDRIVPSQINVNAGDTAGLIAAVNQANTDYANASINDTIVLNANNQSGSVYSFSVVNNTANGSNVLPVIHAANLTIQGSGSTLNADGYGRLFDVASSSGLTLKNLTLTGGMVSGSAAKGGAVYNSGNLKITSCQLGGNQVIGGSGQDGAGGGIYSIGGSLTLVHDVIGIKVFRSINFVTGTMKSSMVGASNQAIGGSGASGQGAGIYVTGGTVKISSATLGGNRAYGGANGSAQGGGIYANGGSVTLVNSHIGGKGNKSYNSTGQLTKISVSGSANSAVAGVGGSAQGGGIYANATTLSLTNSLVDTNSVYGGNGIAGAAGTANQAAGSAGGNAQGGGIYANATTVTISSSEVSFNSAEPGNGGSGAAGTPLHPTGGAGGSSGIGQGGGVYVQGASLTISNAASITGNIVAPFPRAGGPGGAGYNGSGISGAGGAGGKGNVGEGGNVFASNASVLAQGGAMINEGEIFGAYGGVGGAGGKSKAGGAGGDAGLAAGGGLYIANGSVTLGAGVGVNASSVLPGWGGNGGTGGSGGNGGAGGASEGGGLCAINSSVTLSNGTGILNAPNITTPGINNSTLSTTGNGRGGNGGTGTVGAGGNGGAGGLAQGGGVFASGSNLAVTLGTITQGATVNDNSVAGGAGGSGGLGYAGANGIGGTGALGTGGGLAILGDKLVLTNATIASNSVNGGAGGNGASTGNGVLSNFGSGGDAQGGGLFVANSASVTVLDSTFADDEALAGTGTSGGVAAKNSTAKFGLGGTALGGGMYASSSTVNVLNSTFAINLLAAGTNVGTSASAAHITGGGTAQGGGLYSANGALSLINDTVAWNYLVTYANRGAIQGQGGGLYNGPSSTLSLENTIIALDLMFTNSQFGENNANGTYNDFASASSSTLAKNDANLIGGVGGIADVNLAPGGSQQVFAPSLYSNNLGNATLSGQVPGNYGGLTDTLPLAWGNNPALSNGDPTAAAIIASTEYGSSASASSATDQRGSPRLIDLATDLGATQTQVILDGSPSVTSVQAGGSITYKLTVTNKESTAANVTLTDVLDPSTSYQSSSGAGWIITPPTSSTGGTLTASLSLAANSTATLTITVTVASYVPGNTVLANTASVVPTNNSVAGPRGITMNTTVPGVKVTNITSEVEIRHSAINPDPQRGKGYAKERLLIGNDSGATLTGPIALVLVGLTPGVSLANASGIYNGYYYIDLVLPGQSWLAGWRNFLMLVLEFSNPNGYAITYTPEIVQGI